MEITMIILGLIIGLVIMYFVLRPKLITAQKEDEYTKEQNKKLLQEKEKLELDVKQLLLKVSSGNEEIHKA
jgi:uncharacterized membrane-anchored protein YhcB (DUF1043 family)